MMMRLLLLSVGFVRRGRCIVWSLGHCQNDCEASLLLIVRLECPNLRPLRIPSTYRGGVLSALLNKSRIGRFLTAEALRPKDLALVAAIIIDVHAVVAIVSIAE